MLLGETASCTILGQFEEPIRTMAPLLPKSAPEMVMTWPPPRKQLAVWVALTWVAQPVTELIEGGAYDSSGAGGLNTPLEEMTTGNCVPTPGGRVQVTLVDRIN